LSEVKYILFEELLSIKRTCVLKRNTVILGRRKYCVSKKTTQLRDLAELEWFNSID